MRFFSRIARSSCFLLVFVIMTSAHSTSITYTETTELAMATPVIVSGTCGLTQSINPPFYTQKIAFNVNEQVKGITANELYFLYPGSKPLCSKGQVLVLFLKPDPSGVYFLSGHELGVFLTLRDAQGRIRMQNHGNIPMFDATSNKPLNTDKESPELDDFLYSLRRLLNP